MVKKKAAKKLKKRKKVKKQKPLEIEEVDIKKLKLHPDNVREHDEDNIEDIMNSYKEFGQQKPIVVGSKMRVIAGNGQLEAMRRLGFDTVQIIKTDLDDMAQLEFMIADNKTGDTSSWDMDLLSQAMGKLHDADRDLGATGFTPLEIEPLMVDNLPDVPDGFSDDELPDHLDKYDCGELAKLPKIIIVFESELEEKSFCRQAGIDFDKHTSTYLFNKTNFAKDKKCARKKKLQRRK